MAIRYKKGDRLYHLDKKVEFRLLDYERVPNNSFHNGKENTRVLYVGITDTGDRVVGTPENVRKVQKDHNGVLFLKVGHKKIFLNKDYLYHGSNTKISKFKYTGKENSNDEYGVGIYLTQDKEEAKMYGKYIHVLKLEKGKKLRSDEPADLVEARKLILLAPDVETGLSNYAENKEEAIRKFFEYNDTTNKKDLFDSIWHDIYRYDEKEFVENVSKLGYDYSIVKRKTTKFPVFVVYNPEIINIIGVINND